MPNNIEDLKLRDRGVSLDLKDAMLHIQRDGSRIRFSISKPPMAIVFYLSAPRLVTLLPAMAQATLEAIMFYKENGTPEKNLPDDLRE